MELTVKTVIIMKIKNVNVYYGVEEENNSGSSSTTDLSTVSTLSTKGIADDRKNYALYLECDSGASMACEALVNDILRDYRITPGNRQAEIEKWVEDQRLMYSPTTKGVFPSLLEDSFLYGNVAYQLIKDKSKIVRIHRLDPLSTQVLKDPFSNDSIVIHTFTKDNKEQNIIFGKNVVSKTGQPDLKVQEALKGSIKEVKAVSGDITWMNIENCIVFESKSLMKGDCYNAIEKKFNLLYGVGKYIDDRAASPPIAFQVGIVVGDEAIGFPEEGKTEEYQKILDKISQSIPGIKTKGGTSLPGYVTPIPLPFTINNIYLKNTLDKCDQIICSAFYYNEAFTKSGSADFKRTDLRIQRREFLQRLKLKVQALVNSILKIQFEEDMEECFEFIKDTAEERKEQAEADVVVLEGLQKLKDLGADDQSLEWYAERNSFEFKISGSLGKAGTGKEQFGTPEEELSIFGKDLFDKINDELKKASDKAAEKIKKLAEKSSGCLSADDYDKMMAVINKELDKIDKPVKTELRSAIESTLTTDMLPIKENKAAIDFLQNFSFDEIKSLKENQKKRLKHILQNEYHTLGKTNSVKAVTESLKISKSSAKTIVTTELRRASLWSRADHLERIGAENGMTPYLIPICRNDETSCEECKNAAREKKKYTVAEFKAAYPRHPNCHCDFYVEWVKN